MSGVTRETAKIVRLWRQRRGEVIKVQSEMQVAWVAGAGECGRRVTPSPTDHDKDFELYSECSE